MSTRMTQLERAAWKWWTWRRPLGYTEQEHLENPEVNCAGPTDAALARVVASMVKRRKAKVKKAKK